MRAMGCVLMAMAVSVAATGRAQSERRVASADRLSPFETLQHRANALTERGGLAAVGISAGPADERDWVQEEALNNARIEVARILRMKMKLLLTDFFEEIGLPVSDAWDAAGRPAARTSARGSVDQLVAGEYGQYLRTVAGWVLYDVFFSLAPSSSNVLTQRMQGGELQVLVLLCVDPADILRAARLHGSRLGARFARFRDSQAYLELKSEVKNYASHRSRVENLRLELEDAEELEARKTGK